MPSPSQAGQAPKGLLKENSRGSISSMVKPETGQANFSEKMMRSWVSADLWPVPGGDSSGWSANSATAMPSASFSAVSKRVGEPRREVGAHHDAVDHHVDVVLELLVERRSVVDLVELRRRP